MVKVGQIRRFKNNKGEYQIYTISYLGENNIGVIFNDGLGFCVSNSYVEKKGTEIISEYPTWQEAINSKEFKE